MAVNFKVRHMKKLKEKSDIMSILMIAISQIIPLSTLSDWKFYVTIIFIIFATFFLVLNVIKNKQDSKRLKEDSDLIKTLISGQITDNSNKLNEIATNQYVQDLKFRVLSLFQGKEYDSIERGHILNKNFTDDDLKMMGYDDYSILQIRLISDSVYKRYAKVQKDVKEFREMGIRDKLQKENQQNAI